MKRERIISSEELELPDDPETARMATAVVIFCIFAGPTITTMIMLIVIHANSIESFFNSIPVFLHRHPPLTFTLVLFTLVVFGYAVIKKAKR